jgi:protein-tyrosine phosphatase
MNPIHWAFDKLYPFIRFVYEKIQGHDWFDLIDSQLWMGGAPTYKRDYEFLFENGIEAIVDMRAERQDDLELLREHGVHYLQLKVLDVMVPSAEQLDEGTDFIQQHIVDGDSVLIHCAKGRGRSAAMMAAYLMRYKGMSYKEAKALLDDKRPLTNLQGRHQRVLESWIVQYQLDPRSAQATES